MRSLIEKLAKNLRRKGLSISTTESCTGGLLAKTLTDIPGSSNYFTFGLITYSNESKRKLLGVKRSTIKNMGAVSEETAEEMVRGLHRLSKTDIAVSITGIAGPGGGSKINPVGTVFFGLMFKGRIYLYHKLFKGDRDRIRKQSVKFIINEINKKVGG